MVARCCTWCKQSFNARQADVNRGWAKFCSKSCKAKEQEKRTHQNANYHTGLIINSNRVSHRDRRLAIELNGMSPKERADYLHQIEMDEMHEEAMNAVESGWDGHKDVF